MALETALLIVPPKPVQIFSFPLRERYDTEAFDNSVPAHLTLLYPFVPPDQIESTVVKLKKMCADFPPFEMTLDRYGHFEGTVFLEPSKPEQILKLYHRLADAFPEYPIYGGQHGSELHPHLTLAQVENEQEAEKIELPPVPSFTFTVDKLQLYLGSTEDETPFIPRAVVPLGGG
ncbi:MAG: 2'-5' RNA ligase family protein [Anaerolineales bacterium]|jgi:2'-5' RNA ligase